MGVLSPLTPELEAFLTENGYFGLVVVEGVVCGLYDYSTTRSVVISLTADSYERRYCYQNRDEAVLGLRLLIDVRKSHPYGNWIKLKGGFLGKPVDMLNPLWSNSA